MAGQFISGGVTISMVETRAFLSRRAIVGLWYVKWQPYYGKAFTAAETHSIGNPFSPKADANPLMAAWICDGLLCRLKAAVLGVLLGSLIQVLILRDWLLRNSGIIAVSGHAAGSAFSRCPA